MSLFRDSPTKLCRRFVQPSLSFPLKESALRGIPNRTWHESFFRPTFLTDTRACVKEESLLKGETLTQKGWSQFVTHSWRVVWLRIEFLSEMCSLAREEGALRSMLLEGNVSSVAVSGRCGRLKLSTSSARSGWPCMKESFCWLWNDVRCMRMRNNNFLWLVIDLNVASTWYLLGNLKYLLLLLPCTSSIWPWKESINLNLALRSCLEHFKWRIGIPPWLKLITGTHPRVKISPAFFRKHLLTHFGLLTVLIAGTLVHNCRFMINLWAHHRPFVLITKELINQSKSLQLLWSYRHYPRSCSPLFLCNSLIHDSNKRLFLVHKPVVKLFRGPLDA